MAKDQVTIIKCVTKTANYTAFAGEFVRADTTSGGITITLPDATLSENRQIIVKKISSDNNTVIVATTNSQNIDSSTSATTALITVKGMSLVFLSNSVSWDIV